MLQDPPQQNPTQSSSGDTVREVAIGIDLGCTNACIAFFANGRVEVIPNERGNRKTPSYVTFVSKDKVYIGESALEQGYSRRSETTIFGSKYFLGKTTSDQDVFKDLDYFPFTVKEENENLVFHLEFEDGTSYEQKPEEISCLLFKALKVKAENYLNAKVTKAVVSVPSHFNTKQREKTKEACLNAGMEVIDVINDTTAAAIAYTVNKEISHQQDERTVLVYDQGGSSLSVSLLTVQNGKYHTLATTGADGSGGEEINNKLFRHFADQFQQENVGTDITQDKKTVAKLRAACEKVKLQLSICEEVSLKVDALHRDEDFQISMNRKYFNIMNQNLFRKTIDCVESILDVAGVKKEDVKDVLLVGGTTRIPKIQEYLRSIFETEQLMKGINPDEVVACGAAVRAASLTSPTATNLLIEETATIEHSIHSTNVQAAHDEHNCSSDDASKNSQDGEQSSASESANVEKFLLFCQDLDDHFGKVLSKYPTFVKNFKHSVSSTRQHVLALHDANVLTNDDFLAAIGGLDKVFNRMYGGDSKGVDIYVYNEKKNSFVKSLMNNSGAVTLSRQSSAEAAAHNAKKEVYTKAWEALNIVNDTINKASATIKRKEFDSLCAEVNKIRNWLLYNPPVNCSLGDLEAAHERLLELKRNYQGSGMITYL